MLIIEAGTTQDRGSICARFEKACAQAASRRCLRIGVSDVSIVVTLRWLTSTRTFQAPWQKIISATESMASSHQVLAQRIEVDVERPLKEFVIKNRDVQSLSTVQGNLAAMARDVQSATDKVESLRKKGTKAGASKVVNAASELESATSQWNSQAPFVFENLQVVDEARLNHLREVLTRFQTHEVDQVERNRVTAEDCLNALLNVETADEISAFVSRTRPGKVPVERPSSRTMNSSTGSPPVSSTVPEDATSLRSGISAAHGRTDAGRDP